MSKNFSPNAYNQQSFGAAGFDIIKANSSTVTTVDGDWVSVSAVNGNKARCILETSTGDNFSTDGTNPSTFTDNGTMDNIGIDIVSAQTIFGDFKQIKLAAGTSYLIAYRRALG
jgi:hypothetical protein